MDVSWKPGSRTRWLPIAVWAVREDVSRSGMPFGINLVALSDVAELVEQSGG